MQTLSPAAVHTNRSTRRGTPEDWTAAADVALTQFVPASLDVAKARARARCVDGLIIGTGQADFTLGNTAYTLNHQGRAFLLIDVPGIEGNERKFTHQVAQAIAKAHLVFYVNGTNKKPEAATAKKIQSYLGRGTQVCALVNVKEYADAYEFEDDRKCLDPHAGARTALRQTEDVLSAALKPERLLPRPVRPGAAGVLGIGAGTSMRAEHRPPDAQP